MKKEDLRLLSLNEIKLGNNASQTAASINRAWGEGITSDRRVRRWFKIFRSGHESLKDGGRPFIFDNEHLRAIVEQNPRQSVREMFHELGVSSSIVSDHLKQIGKMKKLD
ncbi:histone-lysine N-methyltransferase SETMAR-like [Oratosquilla oratoria]|uniref:histone-lysine N-methyltransferase SETMAR-like n=1 Tax=Oratosquilla oratoria TaxID=337810 RepID=UPI003F7781A5